MRLMLLNVTLVLAYVKFPDTHILLQLSFLIRLLLLNVTLELNVSAISSSGGKWVKAIRKMTLASFSISVQLSLRLCFYLNAILFTEQRGNNKAIVSLVLVNLHYILYYSNIVV